MKKILILGGIFLILTGIILFQQQRLRKFRLENNVLNTNINTLMEGIKRYVVRDSLHAAGVGALQLRVEEYRKLRSDDARLIEELKIRLKRLETTAVHAVQSGYRVAAQLRDTVFVYRERPESARQFSHRSPYIVLDGFLHGDSVKIDLISYDTLLQVVHRIPKRFLFIRYGTKQLRQEVISKNPHSVITHTEFIQITK